MNLWTQVDDYISAELIDPDPYAHVLADSADLPQINVAPSQGKFLALLATMVRAGRILEIGTLGGYSTCWLASALPAEGTIVTMEADPRHAEVAIANLRAAGFAEQATVILGKALDSLAQLESEHTSPFDLVFIDADKVNNAAYVAAAIRLSHPGTVIVVDNVVRAGEVIEASSTDPSVIGSREVMHLLGEHPRLNATALQLVGAKGHDGLAMAVITE